MLAVSRDRADLRDLVGGLHLLGAAFYIFDDGPIWPGTRILETASIWRDLPRSLRMRGKESFGSRLRVPRRLFVVDRVMTQVVAHFGKGETVRCAG